METPQEILSQENKMLEIAIQQFIALARQHLLEIKQPARPQPAMAAEYAIH